MEIASPSANLLVVDDDAGLARLIQKRLQREGYSVKTAVTGAAAMVIASSEPFSLVLVDLQLPDMPGRALIEQLKKTRLELEFAVITGQGDERVAVELMKKGAVDYFVKDADFLEVMPARVRIALENLERKRRLAVAEERLKREHAFNQAILNTAAALVIVVDCRGSIIRFNRAAELVTGYSAQELIGANFLERFVPAEDQADVFGVLNRLAGSEAFSQHVNPILTKSGEQRLITWSNATLKTEDGELEFVIGTGIDITEQRRLEKEILEISGQEQRRIGQDLHDGLGQHLTGIELMTQALEQTLEKKKRPEAESARKIASYVREAIVQTKNLARGLSPVELEQNGLMSAIQELCRKTNDFARVNCSLTCPTPILVEGNARSTHLYRIAQEAVNNALRHGKAENIRVELLPRGEGFAELKVSDDGRGFIPSQRSEGLGLRIMNYRASMIGAILRVQPRETGGTEVSCLFKTGS